MKHFVKPALTAGAAFTLMLVAFKWGEGMLMLTGLLMLAHAGWDVAEVLKEHRNVG
jgi:hypothetical protein